MTDNKDKIIFFASGDFAIPTLEQMIADGFNIKGIVTSTKDKIRFNKKTIKDIACENNIPFYLINKSVEMKDKSFIEWIKSFDADYFCVISFKKLPDEILNMPKKSAFNVHASLLPELRGAAPINWAIRLGHLKTGLTAFELTNEIDKGKIIDNVECKIYVHDNFATLFNRLSLMCKDFTINLFNNKEIKGTKIQNELIDNCKAPKLGRDYFHKWYNKNIIECKNILRSVYPFDGLPISIYVHYNNGEEESLNRLNAKIYAFQYSVCTEPSNTLFFKDYNETITDKKNYLAIKHKNGHTIYITEIQLEGRKKLSIEEFLRGFKYFKKDGYKVSVGYY